jgi:hypothetical protein
VYRGPIGPRLQYLGIFVGCARWGGRYTPRPEEKYQDHKSNVARRSERRVGFAEHDAEGQASTSAEFK